MAIRLREQLDHRTGDCVKHIVAEETGQFDHLVDPKQVITCGDALRCPGADAEELAQIRGDVLTHQATNPA
jgi:hypothetical protein